MWLRLGRGEWRMVREALDDPEGEWLYAARRGRLAAPGGLLHTPRPADVLRGGLSR
ncbi:hypothetical protein WDH52_19565 [Streptomyces sp. TRM70308]|uniref:hypothetical protein n=1 Tax=Streptomyces sp. TRM70308 TaxID=3131932 RepID=UPI003D068F37